MRAICLSAACAALALLAGCHPHAAHPHAAHHHAASEAPSTVSLQGDPQSWKASPHIRDYYEATRAAFANGADAVDVPAYEARSREIFTVFADASGADREAMLDHLKDIPRQVVGIVRDDPTVLDSYDAFWVALSGPE